MINISNLWLMVIIINLQTCISSNTIQSKDAQEVDFYLLHFLNKFSSFGFLVSSAVKEFTGPHRRLRRLGFDPWVGKILWRRKWQPIPVFLPGNPMDRGTWWAAVHGIAKSQTRLSKQAWTSRRQEKNNSGGLNTIIAPLPSHYLLQFLL